MKGRKFRFGALLFAFLLALSALGGCGGSPHNTPEPNPSPQPSPQPQPQVGVLDDWKGEWKSYSSFINAPEMKPTITDGIHVHRIGCPDKKIFELVRLALKVIFLLANFAC